MRPRLGVSNHGRVLRPMLVVVAVLAVGLLCLRWIPATERSPHPFFPDRKPLVIAHQGGDGLRPGNTMLAFRHAAKLGVDVLEMDVHRSVDGVLVAMHDSSVDRTTEGSGYVRDLTWAELSRLDAGYHWPYRGDTTPYRGQAARIPRVQDVLAQFPDLRFNIEIKQVEPDLAPQLCALLQTHDALNRTLVASFNGAPMQSFRRHCPTVATSAHSDEVRWFVVFHLLSLANLVEPEAWALQIPLNYSVDLTSIDLWNDATARGLQVHHWTVNERDEMRRLVDAGVHGIITDYPDRLLEELR